MLNHIVIMGRLTRDPELRRTGSGTAVVNFSIACERDFAGKDGGQKETDFIDVVAWRQTGEFVSKYFTKGRMAVVSGSLQIRGWTDKDGNKRSKAEIVADSVYFGDSKKDADTQNHAAQEQYTVPDIGEIRRKYGSYQEPIYQQSDFAILDDNDAQLPF